MNAILCSGISALVVLALAVHVAYAFGRDRGYWEGYYKGCAQGRRDARTPEPAPRLKHRCMATREVPLSAHEKAEHARITAMFAVVQKDQR